MTFRKDTVSAEILALLPRIGFDAAQEGVALCAVLDKTMKGFSVEKTADTLTVRYEKLSYLTRALALCAEQTDDTYAFSQTACFRHDGAMIDCSRNAVPTVATLKDYLCQMALMGLDTLMLYTEDTYEIEGEPYFGFQRGRFSLSELREIDDFAASYGIEVVPCMQTLAHLNAIFRHRPAYECLHDIDDILLVDEPKTYELIDKMIAACRRAFRSNRIHIGMDEAEHLGRGRFLDRNGPQETREILQRHLEKVCDICKKYDFSPMMWSDMFFKLAKADTGNQYYRSELSQELIDSVPAGVSLVYWDYVTLDSDVYRENLARHALFKNNDTVFAGGAWKWVGYSPRSLYSLETSRLALAECRKAGVKDVFVTLWGDNGAEASLYAVHPALQLFAEMNFHETVDDDLLARRFKTCTDGIFEDFMLADALDTPPGGSDMKLVQPSRYLLYQDNLLGLFDFHVGEGYNDHYKALVEKFRAAAARNPRYAKTFTTWAALSQVLSNKAEIGKALFAAYHAGDKQELKRLATDVLPKIADDVDTLRAAEEAQWMSESKPFGFEILDIRLAGTAARARTAARRVLAFVNGNTEFIPELEAERLRMHPTETDLYWMYWQTMISACPI